MEVVRFCDNFSRESCVFLICELLVCRESGTETTSAAVEAGTAVSLHFALSACIPSDAVA